jgi:hypothetical protein
MCLRKTHDEPKIAQNDIEVWKVLTPIGLSPYRDYQYHPGMNKPACAKTIPVPAEQQEINGGYLHAYTSQEKAEKCKKIRTYVVVQHIGGDTSVSAYFKDGVVQRMIIPKGTIYYEGDDNDICAERLYWPEEGAAHPNPVKIKEI